MKSNTNQIRYSNEFHAKTDARGLFNKLPDNFIMLP